MVCVCVRKRTQKDQIKRRQRKVVEVCQANGPNDIS